MNESILFEAKILRNYKPNRFDRYKYKKLMIAISFVVLSIVSILRSIFLPKSTFFILALFYIPASIFVLYHILSMLITPLIADIEKGTLSIDREKMIIKYKKEQVIIDIKNDLDFLILDYGGHYREIKQEQKITGRENYLYLIYGNERLDIRFLLIYEEQKENLKSCLTNMYFSQVNVYENHLLLKKRTFGLDNKKVYPCQYKKSFHLKNLYPLWRNRLVKFH